VADCGGVCEDRERASWPFKRDRI